MTPEEKQLLLKDLCARLPYGVIVQDRNGTHTLIPGNTELGTEYIKPYLRPMSSMTEEELIDFQKIVKRVLSFTDSKVDFRYWHWNIDSSIDFNLTMEAIDWLNAHHFDYRRLILMGLALEAPADMYKEE